jgi:hypothetical protein
VLFKNSQKLKMKDSFKKTFWKNFAAEIDMLKEAVMLCPDDLWQTDRKFFYLTYHTTIFLDYYLTQPVKEFVPTLPYTITDSSSLPAEAVDDVIPNKFYSRQEILDYLTSIREKCREVTILTTDDKLTERWIDPSEINLHGLCPSMVINYTLLDILFYNLRHVQHHVGQLNYILRQRINKAPEWISHAD